ncbi:MAG: DUF6431 domain-containing protein [Solirubrobacteraceae bacterium]
MSEAMIETALSAGRLRCPSCERPLVCWGFARERQIRLLAGTVTIRPRRARCDACEQTHVIVPAVSVPRRRDGAEVIGQALLAHAHGDGHRRIAARLDRPPGTVRGWIRAFTRRADELADTAQRWIAALTPERAQLLPARGHSRCWRAVNALGLAAKTANLELDRRTDPWELLVALTGGLLHGPLRQPTGL